MVAFDFEVRDIQLHERELFSLLESSRGQTRMFARSIAEEIMVEAKTRVGVRTGRLQRSIKVTRYQLPPGGYLVGSNRPYALVHHEGAQPHIIRPTKPGGLLVFNVKGRTVKTTVVKHPGHAGRKYLTGSMSTVMARRIP